MKKLFAGEFTGMYAKNNKPIHEGCSIKLYYKRNIHYLQGNLRCRVCHVLPTMVR